MRYDLFEAMSQDEAKQMLEELLVRGAEILRDEKIDVKTSLEDLPKLLVEIASRLETEPLPPDPSVPEYIRRTEDYQENLFKFTDDSFRLLIGAAYLVGECFIREYPQLHWGTGNTDYATGNMPVVKGFSNDDEMVPLLSLKNFSSRFVKDSSLSHIFVRYIERWKESV